MDDLVDLYQSVPAAVAADLEKSGLTPVDILLRPLGPSERAASNVSHSGQGYVIPYWSSKGIPLPFYRVKILNPEQEAGIKYKQPRNTVNHIYFPPKFLHTLHKWIRTSTSRAIILTEGEKKAALACKLGFPAVAFGGVDSWRNRTVILPK